MNIGYPSTRYPIHILAEKYLRPALEKANVGQYRRVHFVTHSLGGIVLRQMLAVQPLNNIGRVVMLCPPNQGSELTDVLYDCPLYRSVTGPAGQELGTSECSVPNILGPVTYDVGIIIGTRSYNPLFSLAFAGANDGKVSVERAFVEGMRELIALEVGHTFLMNHREVFAKSQSFIECGSFLSQIESRTANFSFQPAFE